MFPLVFYVFERYLLHAEQYYTSKAYPIFKSFINFTVIINVTLCIIEVLFIRFPEEKYQKKSKIITETPLNMICTQIKKNSYNVSIYLLLKKPENC